MELPSVDAGVETGTCSLLWEHCGREARRADSSYRPLSGLSGQRGKTSKKKIPYVVDNIPAPKNQATVTGKAALLSCGVRE